jgi:hypothetical protein
MYESSPSRGRESYFQDTGNITSLHWALCWIGHLFTEQVNQDNSSSPRPCAASLSRRGTVQLQLHQSRLCRWSFDLFPCQRRRSSGWRDAARTHKSTSSRVSRCMSQPSMLSIRSCCIFLFDVYIILSVIVGGLDITHCHHHQDSSPHQASHYRWIMQPSIRNLIQSSQSYYAHCVLTSLSASTV